MIIRAQCAIGCPQFLFLQIGSKFIAPSTDILKSIPLALKYNAMA